MIWRCLAIGSDYFMAIKKHSVSISNIQQQQFIFKLSSALFDNGLTFGNNRFSFGNNNPVLHCKITRVHFTCVINLHKSGNTFPALFSKQTWRQTKKWRILEFCHSFLIRSLILYPESMFLSLFHCFLCTFTRWQQIWSKPNKMLYEPL